MTNDLQTQTPGETPNVDLSRVDALAAGTVADMVESLPDLADADLETLAATEAKGKNRTGALDAISRETQQRQAGRGVREAEGSNVTMPGDTDNADKAASEIDIGSLTGPTLTRDGWVIPPPKAQPKS